MAFTIEQLYSLLLQLWLPLVRILSLLLFCPVLDNPAFSRKAKIMLALLLSVVLTAQPIVPSPVSDLMSVAMLMLTGEQILWGWLFGHMLWWVFWVLQTAGHMLAMSMGLGMSIMHDPANGTPTVAIAQFLNIYAVLLFFVMDGHLLLVTILHHSFLWWPIGEAISVSMLEKVSGGVGFIIAGALLLALPALLILLLVQAVFGLLNRVSPTLNLFSLGFPISMLFGLFCIGLLSYSLSDHYLKLSYSLLAELARLRVR
ncbi:flagellar biosynthetic protein FliR [Pantoea sp. A4]|uniref:flagellar biosynthetic protein FliR n=1 Tax=Pantoea sp. A4 TaxID=1225184 RepID=UPI0003648077|nr:flagellar biosynthetic protein FliR [Pantoea sp. A4]